MRLLTISKNKMEDKIKEEFNKNTNYLIVKILMLLVFSLFILTACSQNSDVKYEIEEINNKNEVNNEKYEVNFILIVK